MSLFPSIQGADILGLLGKNAATSANFTSNIINNNTARRGQDVERLQAILSKKIADKRIGLEMAKQIQDTVDSQLERELKKQGLDIQREDLARSREDRALTRRMQEERLNESKKQTALQAADFFGSTSGLEESFPGLANSSTTNTPPPTSQPSFPPPTSQPSSSPPDIIQPFDEGKRKQELLDPIDAEISGYDTQLRRTDLPPRLRNQIKDKKTDAQNRRNAVVGQVQEEAIKNERLKEARKPQVLVDREALSKAEIVTDHVSAVKTLRATKDLGEKLTPSENERLKQGKSYITRDVKFITDWIVEGRGGTGPLKSISDPRTLGEYEKPELLKMAIDMALTSGMSKEQISRTIENPGVQKLLNDLPTNNATTTENVNKIFDYVRKVNSVKEVLGGKLIIPNLDEARVHSFNQRIVEPLNKSTKVIGSSFNRRNKFKFGTIEEFEQARQEALDRISGE